MNKLSGLFVFFLISFSSLGQSVLINEDFESGCSFTLVNGTQTNKFIRSSSVASDGIYSLYITDDALSSPPPFSYDYNSTSIVHAYKDLSFPSGETNIQLMFYIKCMGESTLDRLRIYLTSTSSTPVAGVEIASGQIGLSNYSMQGEWIKCGVSLNQGLAGATRRLVFSWKNDGSNGATMPLAIDNIQLVTKSVIPLSGTYTINKDLPSSATNFTDFTDAITQLNAVGISSSVTFNVNAGQVFNNILPVITTTGTNSKSIIFQKYGIGSNPIIRTGGFNTSTDAAIALSGCDYITFDGIDIGLIQSGALAPVEFGYYIINASNTNGAMFNIIKNSKIVLNRSNVSSSGIYQNVVFIPSANSGANHNNTFSNVVIENAYYGIYLAGESSFPDSNCVIGATSGSKTIIGAEISNDIGNDLLMSCGIRAKSQKNIKISDCIIRNITGTSLSVSVYGIFLEEVSGKTSVYNNTIHSISNSATALGTINGLVAGIRSDVLTSNSDSIYNNIIYGLNTNQSIASVSDVSSIVHVAGIITGYTNGNTKVFHNSIRLETSDKINSACFLNTGITNNTSDILNNIFANFTPSQSGVCSHYAIVRQGSQGAFSSINNNDYYIQNSTGGYIGYYTSNRILLSDWQSATAQDANSIIANPEFMMPTLLACRSSLLNNAGTPLHSITKDYEGDSRSLTTPDIGADEFAVNSQNSTIASPTSQIASANISSILTSNAQAVEVFRCKISDIGGDALPTNITNIRLYNNNPTNGADWISNIGGITINDGISNISISNPLIYNSYIDIPISSGNLSIPESSNKTISFSIYLNTSAIEDGKKIQFIINSSNSGWATDNHASLLANTLASNIISNIHTISVVATKLIFSLPVEVIKNAPFYMNVKATDANGNVDKDNASNVAVSLNSGSGSVSSSSGLSKTLIQGSFQWTNVIYNVVGNFSLKAQATGLSQGTSSNIYSGSYVSVGNEETYQDYPFEALYGYSRNAALYKASEISANGMLIALSWYVEVSSPTSIPIKIYLKTTTDTIVNANTWASYTTGSTLVYNSSISFSTSGWNTITLTTPFNYTTNNLLVLTEGNYGSIGNTNYPMFRYSIANQKNGSRRDDYTPPTSLIVNDLRPNIRMHCSVDMTYESCNTNQLIGTADAGGTHQEIIRMEIKTVGNQNPLTVSNFTVNSNNSDNINSNISNAKIFYTANTSTFSAINQFGSAVANPTTTNFVINGSRALQDGMNYFWLTYDINSQAFSGDSIDAEFVKVAISGVDYFPTNSAPINAKTILQKSINSIAVSQASVANVVLNSQNNQILLLDFFVEGPSTGSILLNSINITSTNQNDADIMSSGVKLFNTLSSSTFSSSNLLGTPKSILVGASLFNSLNYNLPSGHTYIWVAYDISASATINNTVDAKILANNINVGGNTYNSVVENPSGNRTIKTPISGTFTVGTNGDFPSLTNSGGLFEYINSYGLSGNIVAVVLSNLSENGTNAINQWNESGIGGYSLTIKPPDTATFVRTISGTSTNTLIRIDGADRITIDGLTGKYLLFRNTHSTPASSGATISFLNNSISCFLNNIYIENNGSSVTHGSVSIEAGINNVSLNLCVLRDATAGTLGTPAIAIYSSSNTNIVSVLNCSILNFNNTSGTSYGIYFNGAGDGCTISGNSFYYNYATAPITSQTVIKIVGGNNHNISNNYIGGKASSCGGTAWVNSANGIFTAMELDVLSTNATNIQGNTIQNIQLSNVNAPTFYGFNLVNGSFNIGSTSRNTLGHASNANSINISGTGNVYAIFSANQGTTNIRNNLIANVTQTIAGTAGFFYGITLKGNAIKNVSRNNIYKVGGTSSSTGTTDVVGIYSEGASSATMTYTIDNNMIALGVGYTNKHVYKGIDDWSFSGNIINVYFNSIVIGGTCNAVVSTYVFLKRYPSTSTLRNNIFINNRTGSGSHYAIGVTNTSTFSSNNNDLFSSNNKLSVWGATPRNTLVLWQTNSGNDALSVNSNITFTDAIGGNLHHSSLVVSNIGINISNINYDYDNIQRDAVVPDIGAVETAGPLTSTFSGIGNWHSSARWSNGISSSSTDVTINGSATVNSSVAARKISINPGFDLLVNTNKSLTITDSIIIKSNNTGTGSFIDKGNFFYTHSKALVQHYIAGSGLRDTIWHLYSSPVHNSPVEIFRWFFVSYWNEPTKAWKYLSDGSLLTDAKGYACFYTGNVSNRPEITLNFTGQLNTGTIFPSITRSTAIGTYAFNWNLIGNPYPSAINIDSLTFSGIDTAVYFWVASGGSNFSGNFATYNRQTKASTNGGQKVVPSMQGFWIRANSANPSITMMNADRLHSSQNFYKEELVKKDYLSIMLENQDFSDETVIAFYQDATPSFDPGFDAVKMFGGYDKVPSIYTTSIDGMQAAINGLPLIVDNESISVPLDMAIGEGGSFKLNFNYVNSFDNNISIHLEDKETHRIFNLKETKEYSFSFNKGDNPSRFLVHFNKHLNTKNINDFQAYYYDNSIYLNNPLTSEAQLFVFNSIGQLITQFKLSSTTLEKVNTTSLAKGMYIIQIVAENENVTKKVVVF